MFKLAKKNIVLGVFTQSLKIFFGLSFISNICLFGDSLINRKVSNGLYTLSYEKSYFEGIYKSHDPYRIIMIFNNKANTYIEIPVFKLQEALDSENLVTVEVEGMLLSRQMVEDLMDKISISYANVSESFLNYFIVNFTEETILLCDQMYKEKSGENMFLHNKKQCLY